MNRFLILILVCCSMTCAIDANAASPKRNAQSVKKERRAAANEVENTRKQINQNTAETRRQLNRLASLNAEAERSQIQINNLNSQIAELDGRINALNDTILMMEGHLSTLRQAYAANLRSIREHRQQMSPLSMIFSSSGFTEAYRRYRYMQELEAWQKNKTEQIAHVSTEIAARRDRVREVRAAQSTKLVTLSAENKRLAANQAEAAALVAELKSQGSSLQKALNEKQRQLKSLDAELDRIIAEEARRAEENRRAEEVRLAADAKKKAEEARRVLADAKKAGEPAAQPTTPAKPQQKPEPQSEPATKNTPTTNLDKVASDNVKLSGSFEANKGKMPFPVSGRYSIVSHFGLNSHREVSNVQVNNSGIDIETAPGATARAVFDGEVSSVFHVSGYRNVVMLRHGNYLTVYAGIDRLNVKKGDKVKGGQALGTIFSDTDDGNRTVLHFEVRRERAKLNPEDWIR